MILGDDVRLGGELVVPRQVAYVPYFPPEIAMAWLLILGLRINALCPGLPIQDLAIVFGK
jgi:hypothetical protein